MDCLLMQTNAEFHVTSCEYLGYMLSPEGLTMALTKSNYPRLARTLESQRHPVFPRIANFYRRFISDTLKSPFHLHVLPARVPLGTSR